MKSIHKNLGRVFLLGFRTNKHAQIAMDKKKLFVFRQRG